MDKKSNKEKNQNIQVFVRLRPLNQRERDIRSLGVVEVCSSREVLVRQSQTPSITKKFTFDRAFGPSSKQVDVYREVVSPLIEEVLAGYNCTVFAYGQTGTGKTHTMVGETSDHIGSKQSDPMAGIIPRSLGQLFDELRLSNSEFTVRVSYLELYNEELFDLLAPGSTESKLKMYEASKGSSEVKGLEEIRVRSKDEVYQILAQGQERRRIASTLMNAQSSRSHTVFTIVVKMNIKDVSGEGEEMVKTGKLNLVDLAGSENISKAGSDNPGKADRKRECVVINQSLLTLGRVITALVERQPHIPYRESKLTRLLQESLGGRTKTSIIATISPGHKDLEETLSTLEYAHRARNIQNKPEVNQKVLKTTVLNEFVDENDRLRRDLQAAWDKNGVCLSQQSYMDIQLQIENQKKEIQEQIIQIKAMKDETDRLESDLKEKMDGLKKTEEMLEEVSDALGQTKQELDSTKHNLSHVKNLYHEQRHIVKAHVETESRLSNEAHQVKQAADEASEDADNLHCTVSKRRKLEEDNIACTRAYGATAGQGCARIRLQLDTHAQRLARDLQTSSEAIQNHLDESLKRQEENKQEVHKLIEHMASALNEVISTINTSSSNLQQSTQQQTQRTTSAISAHGQAAAERLADWARRLVDCLQRASATDRLAVENMKSAAEQWVTTARARLQELEQEHAAGHAAWRAHADSAAAAARREHQRRREQTKSISLAIMTEQQEMLAAKERLEKEINFIMTKNQMFYTNMVELSDMEFDKIERDIKTQAELRESCVKMADSYRESVRDKMAALGSDVAELSEEVVSKVEQEHQKLCREIEQSKLQVEEEMASAAAESKRSCEEASQSVEKALAEATESGLQALHTSLDSVQSYSSTCLSGVKSLSTHMSASHEAEAVAWTARRQELEAAGQLVAQLEDSVKKQVIELEDLKDNFVNKEYKSYSPTGKTPVRKEYRYPHSFSSTSPHERILARLRLQQRSLTHEETIELDNTVDDSGDVGESPRSDTSTTSTDSAVVFVQPSPPQAPPTTPAIRPPTTPTMRPPPVIKSTSESDLYKRQGKENLNHAASLQKLSKLRQPSSHKKVLTPNNRS